MYLAFYFVFFFKNLFRYLEEIVIERNVTSCSVNSAQLENNKKNNKI